jgi:putative salt-induced outer membrane protein YdiY
MVARRMTVAGLWLALSLCGASLARAADDDVVVTKTGDRLVGEIKKLERDVLTLSTVYSDSDFKIEWEDVVSLQSSRQFLVETFDGRRIAGSLQPDPTSAAAVQIAGSSVQLADISALQPFERSFLARFDAGFDFGYSLTRANSAEQLTLGGTLSYRAEHDVDTVFFNVFASSQDNAPETKRWDLGNDYRHLLGTRWYVNTSQDFLNSDEQSLELRSTIGGGAGRYLLRSSSQYLALGAGLAWTNENYTDPALATQNSGEAYVGTEFMTEKLKFADLLTRFSYYPSLTIEDRYRINYTFDLDFNLPGDWYLRTGVFENFDSRPPDELSKNDYGWSNSFGLKF